MWFSQSFLHFVRACVRSCARLLFYVVVAYWWSTHRLAFRLCASQLRKAKVSLVSLCEGTGFSLRWRVVMGLGNPGGRGKLGGNPRDFIWYAINQVVVSSTELEGLFLLNLSVPSGEPLWDALWEEDRWGSSSVPSQKARLCCRLPPPTHPHPTFSEGHLWRGQSMMWKLNTVTAKASSLSPNFVKLPRTMHSLFNETMIKETSSQNLWFK